VVDHCELDCGKRAQWPKLSAVLELFLILDGVEDRLHALIPLRR